MTQIPDELDCVGKGWRSILEDLHQELMGIDPNYQTAQVKEKFGGLRVYLLSEKNDAVLLAVGKALNKSLTTCENCGEPGSLQIENYWVKTLCSSCDSVKYE